MTNLLLVVGFDPGTSKQKLEEYVRLAANAEPKSVWFDPMREPRAVALLDKQYNLDVVRDGWEKNANGSHKLGFAEVEPTPVLLAYVSGSLGNAAADKMRMLFSSKKKGGGKVSDVKDVDESWFEIKFEEGWASVHRACTKQWEIERKKITVCPYFDCFKVLLDSQLQELLSYRKKTKSSIAASDGEGGKQNPETPRNSDKTSFQRKNKTVSPQILLENRSLSALLSILDFEDMLKKALGVTIEIDVDECQATIEGERTLVKSVQKMINKINEIPENPITDQFLTTATIQKKLEELKSTQNLTLSIKEENVIVEKDDGTEISFPDFYSSLVATHICAPTPEHLLGNEDWMKFIHFFHNLSLHDWCRISVDEKDIVLVYLAHSDYEIQNTVDLITNFVKGSVVAKTGNCTETKVVSKNEDDPKSVQVKEMKKKTVVISVKYPIYAKVLNILKDKSDFRYESLEVSVDDDDNVLDISIEGNKEDVAGLKNILIAVEKKIHLSEVEEEFLESDIAFQQIKMMLREFSFTYDRENSKLLIVDPQNGHETPLEYFTSLIMTKLPCGSLSFADAETRKDWSDFVQEMHHTYSLCRISECGGRIEVLCLANSHQGEEVSTLQKRVETKVGELSSSLLAD